jgi:hypothetical protein
MAAPTFTEQIGNLGYIAFGPESTVGTPVTPADFALLDNETMQTSYNFEEQTPIAGNYMDTFQVLAGQRSHMGDITIVGEPNTATYLVDMLLKRGNVSGGGPYTWPFTLASPTKSYTMDIPIGNGLVKRFWGCMAESLAPSWSKNQLMLKASISALGSFQARKIASISGSGPYTVTLATDYTASPTTGLVASDLVRFYTAANPLIDATVASVTGVTTFTTSTDVSTLAAGDIVYLRAQTASYTLLPPFLWSNTEFRFGATASAALSATQTRLEQTSTWQISWPFETKEGSQRSGSADPASLVRLTAQPTFDIKKFFGNPQDVVDFNQLNKSACVIRHFSYSGSNVYELRITLNHLVTDSPVPSVSAKKVNYATIKYLPQYDTSDAQGFDIKVLNNLSSIT